MYTPKALESRRPGCCPQGSREVSCDIIAEAIDGDGGGGEACVP